MHDRMVGGRTPLPRVLFIRGVTQRSGTNFLRDVLLLHPDSVPARAPIWEDFALDEVRLLERYVDRTAARWPEAWSVPKRPLAAEISAELGSAVVRSMIGVREGKTTIAKTPSVQGLESFSRFFPDERLILLVRDGRDVIESMVRTFGWSFERALHTWTVSANAIIRFRHQRAGDEGRTWMLVRYEDALNDAIAQTERICDLAGLARGQIAADDVARLPVRGSSRFATDSGAVHWRPVTPDESFRPVAHWADWTRAAHERFTFVAGQAMRELGYAVDPGEPTSTARKAVYRLQTLRNASGATVRDIRRAAKADLRRPRTHRRLEV
jgi:hypothetical protein